MLLSKEQFFSKLNGEDSSTQYKLKVDHAVSLAEEMVAFANTVGGYILIGIRENKVGIAEIVGVENLKELNNLISNASTEICVPPITPIMQNITIDGKTVVVLHIEAGIQKPYRTKAGKYLMRAGADKRAISQEELTRMLQESASFHTEELPIRDTEIQKDLDKSSYYLFFEREYEQSLIDYLDDNKQSLENLLQNMSLALGNRLNLVGLMMFGRNPQQYRPTFLIKAVTFVGNNIEDTQYISSDDIGGTIDIQYKSAFQFVKTSLLKTQKTDTFNSLGVPEIADIAIEEFLVNALVHRDYSRLGSIKVLIFSDRVEIISPGHLVNHLSVEKIKNGNAIPRNPLLLSFASKMLPYRGLGSGIRRAMSAHPRTDLINDQEGQEFKVIMYR